MRRVAGGAADVLRQSSLVWWLPGYRLPDAMVGDVGPAQMTALTFPWCPHGAATRYLSFQAKEKIRTEVVCCSVDKSWRRGNGRSSAAGGCVVK